MNYELLRKLIPPRKVFEPSNTAHRKLMALHQTLEELRGLFATSTPDMRAELEEQVRFYEQILER